MKARRKFSTKKLILVEVWSDLELHSIQSLCRIGLSYGKGHLPRHCVVSSVSVGLMEGFEPVPVTTARPEKAKRKARGR